MANVLGPKAIKLAISLGEENVFDIVAGRKEQMTS